MLVNVLLLLLCVLETLQHLSYPINFCNMASTCIHDSRGVCASSPDGCSRKSFLDQCDMYEYNCDYGTQFMTKVTSSCTSGYQETYILFCGNLLTSTQLTQIQSSTNKDPDNGITSSINPSISLTVTTNTPVTHSIKQNSEENNVNKNENDTIVNQTTTVYCCDRPLTWETTTEVTYVFEDISTENNNSEENLIDEIDKNKQTTETTMAYNITDNLSDDSTNIDDNENETIFTTITQQVSDIVKLHDTTLYENNKTDEALNEKKIVIQNSSVYCCDRPLTWETTTEVTHISQSHIEDIIAEKNNSVENFIDETVNDQDENKQTTETTKEYNFTDNLYDQTTNIQENESNIIFTIISQQVSDTVLLDNTMLYDNNKADEALDEKLSALEIPTQSSPVYCCNRPLTWETTTEATKTFEVVTTEKNNSDENKIINTVQEQDENEFIQKMTVTDTTKYSTSSTTVRKKKIPTKKLSLFSKKTKCNNKCQRPLTWLTTLRRRKHF